MRDLIDRLRRRLSDADLREEVDSHLAHEIDDQLDRGLSPEQARYVALRKFGNVTRHLERFRETSPAFWLESLGQDIRYAWRSVRRSRVLFLTSVLSLALGIGGSTALFSVLHATVLNPFTYPRSNRLAVFSAPVKARDLHGYAALTDTFDGVGGYVGSMWLVNDADDPTAMGIISCNFFDVAGVRAVLGRTPSDDDCSPSAPAVIVLSHELWTRSFGANPDVIGQTLRLKQFRGQNMRIDQQIPTIIGIMPPRVSFSAEKAWIPSKAALDADYIFYVLARLRADVTLGDAGTRVATMSAHLAARERQEAASPRPPARVGLDWLHDRTVRDYRTTIYALLGGAGCVLLIGCMNVAMLLFARATAGHAEIGMRVCLGAGVGRIIRQVGVESVLLSACGGILGIGLATAALPTLSAFVLTAGVAPQADIRLNLAAVAVAAGLVVLAALLFGIGPAIYAMRLDPARALGGGSRTTHPPHSRRWRTRIVATQIGVMFPVYCAALALAESFMSLHAATVKYGPDHLLLVVAPELGLEAARDQLTIEHDRLWRQIDAAIQAVPGVRSVAITAPLALNRATAATVEPVGGSNAPEWPAQLRCASPNFFSTMNVDVVRGRTFDPTGAMSRQRVAVVSRSFVRAYFGDNDPIGSNVRITKTAPVCPPGNDPLEIVGIVENTQLPDVQTGSPDSPPTLYVSTEVATPRLAQFLVRTSVPASTIRRDVQRAVAAVNPELVARARSLQEDVEEAWMPWPRLLVRAALSCSAAGLLLVLVGVFGVLSYSIAQLGREMCIRMALGASPAQIGREVLRRGMESAILGVSMGTVATLVLQGVIRSRMWGLAPLDWRLIAGIAAVVLTAIGVVSWFPARRAMRLDPVIVLRSE